MGRRLSKILLYLSVTVIILTVYECVPESGFPVVVKAATNTCGEELTWEIEGDTLTISGTGAMADFTTKTIPWLSSSGQIKNIIIEDGVTSIGEYAFSYCQKLERVIIAGSVKRIGDAAFATCQNLEEIVLPDSVTWMGDNVFQNCKKLTDVTLPKRLTDTGDGTFSYCTGLAGIVLPSGLTIIGDNVFSGCTGLSEITLPDSLVSIGDLAFRNCTSLSEIVLPDGLIDIEGSAFNDCTCLENIGVKEGNEFYSSRDGVLFDKEQTMLVMYRKKLPTSYTIPAGVTNIGESAFSNCSNLTEITIPGSVTKIGESAFSYCSNLAKITIPDSVTDIGESALSYCSGLTEVTLSAAMTNISDSLFENCSNLTKIELPESVTGIGKAAFKNCSRLTNITLPVGMECVEQSTFDGCSALTGITLPESVKSIEGSAFANCSNLTGITLPTGLKKLGGGAFRSCWGLTDIGIPDGITSIEASTFYSCRNLVSVDLPKGVTSIGPFAFRECSKLKDIEIPSRVTNIGYYAFFECFELTTITIPEGVRKIGDATFYHCTGLKNVELPQGLIDIGSMAFQYCESLQEITIPESVERIQKSAFGYCSNLTRITMPKYLNTIGESVFIGCKNLTDIEIPNGVSSVGDHAFQGCNALTNVVLPDTIDIVGWGAFCNCKQLKRIVLPDSMILIGVEAFSGIDADATAYLYHNNGSFTTIPASVIAHTVKVTESGLNCGAGGANAKYVLTEEGVLIIDGTGSISDSCPWAAQKSDIRRVVIGEGITGIGANAFSDCPNLVSVTLPDSLTGLGDNAFTNCTSLADVAIPNKVTSIGEHVFDGCSSDLKLKVACNFKKTLLADYSSAIEDVHKVIYSAKNDTITVTCQICKRSANLRIRAKDVEYNGKEQKTAWLEESGWNFHGTMCVPEFEITYSDDVTNAGEVTASLVIVSAIRADITYQIKPRPVTIAAENQTMTYGEKVKRGKKQVAVSGLLKNQKMSRITLTPSGLDATQNGTITPSNAVIKNSTGKVTSNYDITYQSGVLIINKADGKADVTMEDCHCHDTTTSPVPRSETNGTAHVTYWYKSVDAPDTAYAATKPSTAGEYMVKAVFEATKNYREAVATDTFEITHGFSEEWSRDDTVHWHECPCGDRKDCAGHVYDNDGDATCNVCGYSRTIVTIPPEITEPPTAPPVETLPPGMTEVPTEAPTAPPIETLPPGITEVPTAPPVETLPPGVTEAPTKVPTESPLQTIPPVTGEPTKFPYETFSPVTSEPPTVSSAPGSTIRPTVSSTPGSTIRPTVSSTPGSTISPTVSSTPGSTLRPTVSSTPGSTLSPTVSSTPGATIKPTVTFTPESTGKPPVTLTPEPTEKPIVTLKPAGEDLLWVIGTPKPTVIPTVTPTMKPVETPQSVVLTVTGSNIPDYLQKPEEENDDDEDDEDDESHLSGNDLDAKKNLPLLLVKGEQKKSKGVAKNAVVLTWEKSTGVDGYEVYWSYCDGRKNFQKMKTVMTGEKLTCTHKKLKKNRAYKYFVISYKLIGGRKFYFSKSPNIHIAMKREKCTNARAIKVKKKVRTVKAKATFKIKASVIKEDKTKKLLAHAPELRYYTEDKKIVSVDKKGKVKARKRGKCNVYIIANNGAYAKMKVTVK